VNVVFVSHCDFQGNSAMHIFSIANELQAMDVDSVVCVPNDPGTVRSHGSPRFQVLHHDEALRQPIVFPDGRGPDLVHAWTPRELVRQLTEALARRYAVPYLVHLEDNEEVIVEDELEGPSFAELGSLPLPLIDQLVAAHRSHPVYYPRFLANAAGVTVLMDRLLEFKPVHVPGQGLTRPSLTYRRTSLTRPFAGGWVCPAPTWSRPTPATSTRRTSTKPAALWSRSPP
jgi:hypothetical protein